MDNGNISPEDMVVEFYTQVVSVYIHVCWFTSHPRIFRTYRDATFRAIFTRQGIIVPLHIFTRQGIVISYIYTIVFTREGIVILYL